MEITRRGHVVIAICAVSILFAWLFGTRSLNVVIITGAITFGHGIYQVARFQPPAIHRDIPPDGHVGETQSVTISFHDPDVSFKSPVPMYTVVEEQLGRGLTVLTDDRIRLADAQTPDGSLIHFETTLGLEDITYNVEYASRGTQELGPVYLDVFDTFGLLKQTIELDRTDTVLVYPQRYHLPTTIRWHLGVANGGQQNRRRDEFDRLREYTPGDNLRDIHWPSTAKQDAIVVKQFIAESDSGILTIAGGAAPGAADDMATALTSIALELHEAGIPLQVLVPSGEVTSAGGPNHPRELLELLSTTKGGALAAEEADITVFADRSETTVSLHDQEVRFDSLLDPESDPLSPIIGAVSKDTESTPEKTHRPANLLDRGGDIP